MGNGDTDSVQIQRFLIVLFQSYIYRAFQNSHPPESKRFYTDHVGIPENLVIFFYEKVLGIQDL